MILVPATLDDWKQRLGESTTAQTRIAPAKLADRWQAAAGFPVEVARLLSTTAATRRAALLVAVPNHCVPLAGGAHASKVDLWVLARTRDGLVSLAIDAIGSESFDAEARDRSSDVESHVLWKRLGRLLEIDESPDVPVSSQLLHRTIAALLEARRFFARSAAVVVHSFSNGHGFADFQRFVKLMGGAIVEPGQMIEVPPREGIELLFGWAQAPHGDSAISGA